MREVKKEIEALEMIYQNILMIKDSHIRVIKDNKLDENLKNDIKDVIFKYNKIIQSIRGMLKTRNKEVKDLSIAQKMATYMSIKINLNKECKSKDIASMLIQDINFTSDEIKKIVNEYSKISKTIINLSGRIIISNNNCINKLKKYVSWL